MNNKTRVYAVMAGQPVDRCPVTSLYHDLYHLDHFTELTGLSAWERHRWLASTASEAFLDIYDRMHRGATFELLQTCHSAPSRVWRERQEFVERDGGIFRHDRVTDGWQRLDVDTASGHATDYHANETQTVFDTADVDARVTVTPAECQLADGANDFIDALISRYGRDEYIISGGVIGTLYSCHGYVGLTNLFELLIEQPALIERLSECILAQNIQSIRRMAAAGGDAIYIDDATATADMISVPMYERFCLPYLREMVAEIHRLDHHAILIYFGDVMDRLELIAATGADAMQYEASMKGFVNDTAAIARRIGDRLTLFTNIDPVGVLQNGTDAELDAEISRQVDAARPARGCIISTGSPITPATPLARVRRFIDRAQTLGGC